MGRPALNLTPIQLRLAPETLARIEALVGTHKRPAFIREAIERELERRESKTVL